MVSPSQPLYSNIKGPQIRLCDIPPGAFGDPISCKLHTVSLDDDVEYDAFSYVWGTQRSTSHLNRRLRASRHQQSRHGLPFLRVDRICTIWIDAIWIYTDQSRTKHLGNLRLHLNFLKSDSSGNPNTIRRNHKDSSRSQNHNTNSDDSQRNQKRNKSGNQPRNQPANWSRNWSSQNNQSRWTKRRPTIEFHGFD